MTMTTTPAFMKLSSADRKMVAGLNHSDILSVCNSIAVWFSPIANNKKRRIVCVQEFRNGQLGISIRDNGNNEMLNGCYVAFLNLD